jgi:prolipoprotein diacylglyceryl transferase
VIGYIPSPSSSSLSIGPLQLHFYGLIIAVAVLVAAWLMQRRWVRLGGFAGTIVPIGFWAVVAGLVCARLYSVATSWQQDTGGDFVQIFEIWNGGLSIWGGVSGGVLGGWLRARRMHVPLPPLLDVVAPGLPLAQAIGRWGNYFNQELFGLPSKLPWALRITNQAQLASLPHKYQTHLGAAGRYLPGTFQPTFLYESIWDLAVFGLLLLIERKVKLRRGYLFGAYAALYTFGRFWTEYLRIDPAHRYLGLRLNDWTSVGVFAISSAVLLFKGRPKPGDELVGDELPPELLAEERARALRASRRAEQPAPTEPPEDTAAEPPEDTAAEPPEDTAAEPPEDTAAEPPEDTAAEPLADLAVVVEPAPGDAPPPQTMEAPGPAGEVASAGEAPAQAATEQAATEQAATEQAATEEAQPVGVDDVATPKEQAAGPAIVTQTLPTSVTEGDTP